jgi:hypothetical protein
MKVQERRRRYRASIPGPGQASSQRKYDKAMSGRDPRAAIAAKCLDCMHWQRGRIAACPIVCCPLWPYRPFARGEKLEATAASKKRKKPRHPTSPKSSAPRRPRRSKSARGCKKA